MRFVLVLFVSWVGVAGVFAQEKEKEKEKFKPPRRYMIEANLELFPQDHPKTALHSVIKAIEENKIDYLLAQLADPRFVDRRVELYNGDFDALVKETTDHLANDPTLLKTLKRIVREGEWDSDNKTASAYLKDNKDQRVFFRKIGDRWFFENRQQAKEK